MRALARGWREAGRPALQVALKAFFAQRLDLALAVGMQAVAPGGLGVALSRGLRLVVAARVARSVGAGGSKAGDPIDSTGAGQGATGGEETAGCNKSPAAGRRNGAAALAVPKGLGSMPPLPLPRIPPGGLASCSVQPIGKLGWGIKGWAWKYIES